MVQLITLANAQSSQPSQKELANLQGSGQIKPLLPTPIKSMNQTQLIASSCNMASIRYNLPVF